MAIQREILRNGAVVVDWYSPPYAKTYHEGIFKKNEKARDPKFQVESNGEIIPNHASILIGWGESSKGKYWILRNSMGEEFGMGGHMYIERGKNTFAIE